jgi:hypothetical protein
VKSETSEDVLSRLFGIVEIDNGSLFLIISSVFIVVFVVVCAIAYRLLAKGQSTPSGWHLQFRLPVSKPTFEHITTATAAAMRAPDVSATTRARFDALAGSRKTFVVVYRTVMIAVGLAGLTGAVLLLRSHTPGNMNGLPGGIILLLSLGALLNGLLPGPSIKPVEPLDSDQRDQISHKIKVQVTTAEPLTVAVTENQLRRAAEMIRQGVSPEDAARAVAAANDSLNEADQEAIAAAVAHYLRRNP